MLWWAFWIITPSCEIAINFLAWDARAKITEVEFLIILKFKVFGPWHLTSILSLTHWVSSDPLLRTLLRPIFYFKYIGKRASPSLGFDVRMSCSRTLIFRVLEVKLKVGIKVESRYRCRVLLNVRYRKIKRLIKLGHLPWSLLRLVDLVFSEAIIRFELQLIGFLLKWIVLNILRDRWYFFFLKGGLKWIATLQFILWSRWWDIKISKLSSTKLLWREFKRLIKSLRLVCKKILCPSFSLIVSNIRYES